MGNVIRKLLWLLVAGSIAVAVIRIIPWGHPNEVWQSLGSAADSFGSWVRGLVDSLHLERLPQPEHPIELPTPQVSAEAPVGAPAG